MIDKYPMNVYTEKAAKVLEFLDILWHETGRHSWDGARCTYNFATLHFNEDRELTAYLSVSRDHSVADFRRNIGNALKFLAKKLKLNELKDNEVMTKIPDNSEYLPHRLCGIAYLHNNFALNRKLKALQRYHDNEKIFKTFCEGIEIRPRDFYIVASWLRGVSFDKLAQKYGAEVVDELIGKPADPFQREAGKLRVKAYFEADSAYFAELYTLRKESDYFDDDFESKQIKLQDKYENALKEIDSNWMI